MKPEPPSGINPDRARAALLLWIIWLTVGCSACAGEQIERRRQAQEIWKEHEAAVVRALDGHLENDEFVHAVDFFARVTGIEIDVNIFTLGYLPTSETRKDFDRVRDWYSERKDDLFFDPESQSVVVEPR